MARQLVVFLKRPGGQAQFSATLSLQRGGGGFDDLHAWIGDNLGADLSIPNLAARAGMSERTFLRRYKQAAGCSPAKAIERLRVEAAQRRLCESREPIKRVAARCGFGSEETMRRSFARIARVVAAGLSRALFALSSACRLAYPGGRIKLEGLRSSPVSMVFSMTFVEFLRSAKPQNRPYQAASPGGFRRHAQGRRADGRGARSALRTRAPRA